MNRDDYIRELTTLEDYIKYQEMVHTRIVNQLINENQYLKELLREEGMNAGDSCTHKEWLFIRDHR